MTVCQRHEFDSPLGAWVAVAIGFAAVALISLVDARESQEWAPVKDNENQFALAVGRDFGTTVGTGSRYGT